jgi:hypothetical protein
MGLFDMFKDPEAVKNISGMPIENYVDDPTFICKRYEKNELWRIYEMISVHPPGSVLGKVGFTHGVVAGPAWQPESTTPFLTYLGIKDRKIVKVWPEPKMLF